jgi:hypothetical protein
MTSGSVAWHSDWEMPSIGWATVLLPRRALLILCRGIVGQMFDVHRQIAPTCGFH